MTIKTEKTTEPAEETASEETASEETASEETAAEAVEPTDEVDESAEADDLDDDLDDLAMDGADAASGVGAGAAAVVSAGLGLAALTGTWVGKVSSEREALVGQIQAQGGTPAQQINEIYADAWHATALVNGVFAFLALLVGVLVLVLVSPQRPVWVRAVAVGGAVLGAIGMLLSAGMYFDLFLSLPTAP
ncbi:hypothetical protein Q5762_15370 [Streptomyces sp. P9(2023)]|uniref:hypothetical protein n=1 Tax=Streptomyces sp. P9(2023) TaxID=3064394 RepID=UPI0028F41C15|nr:hypothetical protein [Streptomyces sp. P9(2023)]MDT9689692.1 hypothetical protein [Streptomyces sp. P9(2023)]